MSGGSSSTAQAGPTNYGAVALCCLTLIIDGLDLQLLAFTAPSILAEWKITPGVLGPALAASLVGMAVGNFLGGSLGDRWGRRPMLIASTLAFGLPTLSTYWTQSLEMLIALRFLCGLGFGAAIPNAMTLASEWTPTRVRPLVIGILAVGTPLGGMLGAVLVGSLLDTFGWRGCFLLSGGLTILLAVVMIFVLTESPFHRTANSSGDDNKGKLDDGTIAGAGETYLDRRNLRSNFGIALAFFANLYACYTVINWLPVAVTTGGLPLQTAIRTGFFYNLFSILGALLSAYGVRQWGTKTAGIGFLGLSVLAVAGMGWCVVSASEAALLSATASLAGLLMGSAQATLYTLVTFIYPARYRATGVGIATAAGRVGGIAAVLAGGVMLSSGRGGLAVFFLVVALAIVIAIGALFIIDRHRKSLRNAAGPLPGGKPEPAEVPVRQ